MKQKNWKYNILALFKETVFQKTVKIKWYLSENFTFQNLLKNRKLLPDEKLVFDKESKRKLYHLCGQFYYNNLWITLGLKFLFWLNGKLFDFEKNPFRSSHPEAFLEKGVFKICSKFTREHPCQSGISKKFLYNYSEITLRHGCSPVNLLHIFKTTFLNNTSGRLFLSIEILWIISYNKCILVRLWVKVFQSKRWVHAEIALHAI